jgi:hypothetical protein
MDESEFAVELRTALERHSAAVTEKLGKVLAVLPDKTEAVSITVSPTQDGDGVFDIFVSLDGPDLHVLNKRIRDHYQLFSPIHTADGIEPYIPDVDPFDVDFEVNDIVADVVVPWLESLWTQVHSEEVHVPIGIHVEGGHGSRPSVKLK